MNTAARNPDLEMIFPIGTISSTNSTPLLRALLDDQYGERVEQVLESPDQRASIEYAIRGGNRGMCKAALEIYGPELFGEVEREVIASKAIESQNTADILDFSLLKSNNNETNPTFKEEDIPVGNNYGDINHLPSTENQKDPRFLENVVRNLKGEPRNKDILDTIEELPSKQIDDSKNTGNEQLVGEESNSEKISNPLLEAVKSGDFSNFQTPQKERNTGTKVTEIITDQNSEEEEKIINTTTSNISPRLDNVIQLQRKLTAANKEKSEISNLNFSNINVTATSDDTLIKSVGINTAEETSTIRDRQTSTIDETPNNEGNDDNEINYLDTPSNTEKDTGNDEHDEITYLELPKNSKKVSLMNRIGSIFKGSGNAQTTGVISDGLKEIIEEDKEARIIDSEQMIASEEEYTEEEYTEEEVFENSFDLSADNTHMSTRDQHEELNRTKNSINNTWEHKIKEEVEVVTESKTVRRSSWSPIKLFNFTKKQFGSTKEITVNVIKWRGLRMEVSNIKMPSDAQLKKLVIKMIEERLGKIDSNLELQAQVNDMYEKSESAQEKGMKKSFESILESHPEAEKRKVKKNDRVSKMKIKNADTIGGEKKLEKYESEGANGIKDIIRLDKVEYPIENSNSLEVHYNSNYDQIGTVYAKVKLDGLALPQEKFTDLEELDDYIGEILKK